MTFRLSAEERSAAENVADRNGWLLSDVMREALRVYLDADAEVHGSTA